MALAGVGAAATVWHWTNEWRERNGKKRLMFEPIHLVAVGLLIALCGVAWQIYRDANAPAARPVAAIAKPTAAAPAKPRYTRAGIEGRLQALARIKDVVEKVSDDFYALRKPVFDGWPTEWPKMGPKGYVKQAEELRARLERAHPDMRAVLQKIDYGELKGLWWEWKAPPALILHLNVWSETIAALPESARHERLPTQKAAWNLYVEAIHLLERWITETREQIAAKRAEYEAADHQ